MRALPAPTPVRPPAITACQGAATVARSSELRGILFLLLVVEVFAWSLVFGHPVDRGLQNAVFAGAAFGWTLWLHRRWSVAPLISLNAWLSLLHVLLALVSIIHWRWLSEASTEYGTGISDAHYVLDFIRGTGPDYALAYLGGYAVWLYPFVSAFGLENFYAIALLNTALIALAALALAVVMSSVSGSWRALPVVAFLFHPYPLVLAATIYKDPLAISGTVLVFCGICKVLVAGAGRQVPKPGLLVLAGLALCVLARPAYALMVFLFVYVFFFLQTVRHGRIGANTLRLFAISALALAAAVFAAIYLDIASVIFNSVRRVYDPAAGADLSASTGGYTADSASLAVRYMSGPLSQRLVNLPLLIVMQLLSPFPPKLWPIEHVYIWVEECFGPINLTLLPLLGVGLIGALRRSSGVLRWLPLYGFFIIMPAIAFGGVIGRQLSPIVPFLMILAWLGWQRLPNPLSRATVGLLIPMCWALAFGAYAYLRGL